jgi:hypothetical protein
VGGDGVRDGVHDGHQRASLRRGGGAGLPSMPYLSITHGLLPSFPDGPVGRYRVPHVCNRRVCSPCMRSGTRRKGCSSAWTILIAWLQDELHWKHGEWVASCIMYVLTIESHMVLLCSLHAYSTSTDLQIPNASRIPPRCSRLPGRCQPPGLEQRYTKVRLIIGDFPPPPIICYQ